MSTTTNSSLSGTALRGALTIVRLPLTAVEAVTGRRGASWPPAVVFASLEASVLQLAGAALHDEALAEQGRGRQEAATRRGRATRLDAAAGAAEQKALRRREQRERAAKASADEAHREAEQKREQIEQTAGRRREAAAATGRTRQRQVQQQKAAEQKRRRTRERADRLAVLEEAEQAQVEQAEALQARRAAAEAEDAFEHARTQRREG